jgi:hypothetical protein
MADKVRLTEADALEAAIDRLDNYVSSLVNLTMLPASIHVSALREGLPEIAKELRRAHRASSGKGE